MRWINNHRCSSLVLACRCKTNMIHIAFNFLQNYKMKFIFVPPKHRWISPLKNGKLSAFRYNITGSSKLRRGVHLIFNPPKVFIHLCCRGIARRGAHSDRRAIMVWRSLTSRPATPTSTRKDPPSNIRPSRMAAGPLRRVTRRRRTAQTSRCRLTLSSGWVDGCPTTAAAGHGSASPGSTRSTRSRSRPTSPTTRPGRKVRGGAAADAVAVTWVVHV